MDWIAATNSMQKALMGTFGRKDVTYTPEGGAAVAIRGIFRREHAEVNVGKGLPTSSVRTTLGVRIADMPEFPAGKRATITVAGVDYRVIDNEEDGEGGATLLLHKL